MWSTRKLSNDRATQAMNFYAQRVQAVLSKVENEPGIEVHRITATMALELKVRPDKIDEYIVTLVDAGKVHADMGRLYTKEAWFIKNDEEQRKQQEIMGQAKLLGMSPLEGFETTKE